ncbi:hypothetical protein [Pseudogulbenkiania sp. MAI-1]|uniref:hypothetical protein n=1 Tax=Pseudogulbenkiania sp. MAI-1 TaxID=990370 RepID=UPI00045E9B8A|nr:hypothetical protein [Pseudogulbenkiania sp. MAI-1]
MNITGSIPSIGYAASVPETAYRTERSPLPESNPDSSDEASSLALNIGTTVPRRSESVAQVESELSRQLAVSQTTGTEAGGAAPDATTAGGSKRPTIAATSETDPSPHPSPQATPAEMTAANPPGTSAQLAVAHYQAHQSLLETSSDSTRRLSITA